MLTPLFLSRWFRTLCQVVIVLAMAGCSRALQERPRQPYRVALGMVLIPDSALSGYGGSYSAEENRYDFARPEDRTRLAEQVLGEPAAFPLCRLQGNWAPIAYTGKETALKWLPEVGPAPFSLEEDGVRLERFDAVIGVYEEDLSGQIICRWRFRYDVTLAKPVNDSTRHEGASGPGGHLFSGRAELVPLFRFEGKALWVVVRLDRDGHPVAD